MTQSGIAFYAPVGPYWWLANVAPITVGWRGRRWPTLEHAFQAEKYFPRRVLAHRIAACASPLQAKRLAGELSAFRRSDWRVRRVDIMRDLTRAKYLQHRCMKDRLLRTGTVRITEAAMDDDFWGAGPDGRGLNMMGQLIMEVRFELQRGVASAARWKERR